MIEITDASGDRGCAQQVIAPRHEEELAEVLTKAYASGIPVTFAGSLTGVAGGAVPNGGWSISLANFNGVEIDGDRAIAGAGALLRDVQSAARDAGRFYPPDPTENTSSIGGNIATNASGSRSYRFGDTRRYVEALRVVLADGSIKAVRRGEPVDFDVPAIRLPRTTKHAAGLRLAPGMDWVDLFVGSEGTLGVVTRAELRLLDLPRREVVAGVVFFASDDLALDAVERWRANPDIRMIEYFDRPSLAVMEVAHRAALLVELEGDDLDLTGAIESDSWFAISVTDRERLRQFRHALPERVNALVRQNGFAKQSSDCAVPLESNRHMLAYYRSRLEAELPGRYTIFGHVGDAHLHVNILPATQAEFDRGRELLEEFALHAIELDGTIAAEHGLGKRKTHLLSRLYPAADFEAMLAIKHRFDPARLLGPGTLFPY